MKSMAAIQTEFGKNVQVEEIDIPDPLDEQVVIKLKSTGVCHSQLHHMKSPSDKTQRPLSLGHEGTGYVEKLGKISIWVLFIQIQNQLNLGHFTLIFKWT